MKTILLTFVTFFITLNIAVSCNCRILNEFGQILDDNDQIFIGTVLKVDDSVSPVKFDFQVDKKWKGKLESQITISTSKGDCAYDFQVGETYVVYSKNYSTNLCRRNSLLKETFDEKLLDHYFSGKPIRKKLEDSDMNVLSKKIEEEEDLAKYMVVFDYRILYPKEVYKFHPRLINKSSVKIIILTKEEKEIVGECIDKLIVTGTVLPKKGWSRKKIIKVAKKKNACKD